MGAVVIGAIILWIVPIFVANSQGKAKNRAGIAYGLFLGWLGVLVLAVLPPNHGTREDTANPKLAGLNRSLGLAGDDHQALTQVSRRAREVARSGDPSTSRQAELIAREAEARLNANAVRTTTTAPTADSSDEALAIARRRYASGELTREEFQQIESDLLEDRSAPA